MSHDYDMRTASCSVYFLPVETRVPLKFGGETLTHVTCVRVRMEVEGRDGRHSEGWGETPLSVQWAWPGDRSYEMRNDAMMRLCCRLAHEWTELGEYGHPIELGWDFLENVVSRVATEFDGMPWLAALISASAFDIALHDAYGNLHKVSVYETYNARFMNRDLSSFLEDADGRRDLFAGRYPEHYLRRNPPDKVPVWHLLGGQDAIGPADLRGDEPADDYPVLLRDWIHRDGLQCIKVKLRGNDSEWDWKRLVEVGRVAREEAVVWLTADFNCMVVDPEYVTLILDRLIADDPVTYQKILYVEQPFPYDLESNPIDVHSVSARKPLFMDESAHDWRLIRSGRTLGWTGVALKTCKTQTGALLSLSWAKAHGMTLMVQDLTNPMLAQLSHLQLARHADTVMGVESNGMQFYPDASLPESAVHPGAYRRQNGLIDLASLRGPGFGYRIDEIGRSLPPPTCTFP
ncbi:MAG TPA: mandelate racemase/muconate lactonizing enzyme family protein [Spirochaetia bacterium]|nr:mandelate racemase/muconate lactonizing enzyme family protein [Spirochaetia bacterium]